jgi:hypothetical protein
VKARSWKNFSVHSLWIDREQQGEKTGIKRRAEMAFEKETECPAAAKKKLRTLPWQT